MLIIKWLFKLYISTTLVYLRTTGVLQCSGNDDSDYVVKGLPVCVKAVKDAGGKKRQHLFTELCFRLPVAKQQSLQQQLWSSEKKCFLSRYNIQKVPFYETVC